MQEIKSLKAPKWARKTKVWLWSSNWRSWQSFPREKETRYSELKLSCEAEFKKRIRVSNKWQQRSTQKVLSLWLANVVVVGEVKNTTHVDIPPNKLGLSSYLWYQYPPSQMITDAIITHHQCMWTSLYMYGAGEDQKSPERRLEPPWGKGANMEGSWVLQRTAGFVVLVQLWIAYLVSLAVLQGTGFWFIEIQINR